MTPSQQAKAAGLKTLSQVIELTGVSRQTLENWHRYKPELFKTVLQGCLLMERVNAVTDVIERLQLIVDSMDSAGNLPKDYLQ